MKPSWKDAPDWAQWLAMDEDGKWWWYENPPYTDLIDKRWITKGYDTCEVYCTESSKWKETLQERP